MSCVFIGIFFTIVGAALGALGWSVCARKKEPTLNANLSSAYANL